MELSSLLAYAKSNIPYYKQLNIPDHANIQSFPIITKNEYIKLGKTLFKDLNNIRNMIDFKTSGSTGTPMVIYKSNRDYLAQLRCLWRRRYGINGIKSNDKCINFILSNSRQQNVNDFVRIKDKMMMISIDTIEKNITAIIEEIHEFQPRYIIGYPSVISYFADVMDKNDLTLPDSIHYIESMGEYLFPSQKKHIEDTLKIAVTNYYGCTEIFGIAYACKEGRLHIISDNVFVEVIPPGENRSHYELEGNIVVTGLNSIDTTFIRYNLEDTGIMYRGCECSCGCRDDYIEVSMARRYRTVRVSQDRLVHSSYFFGVIDVINSNLNQCIIWFKYVQEDYDHYQLLLQVKKGYEIFFPEIEKRVVNMFREYLGNDIVIRVIPATMAQGVSQMTKYEYIESNIVLRKSMCLD
jgi:phenylacetate-CoA ligase